MDLSPETVKYVSGLGVIGVFVYLLDKVGAFIKMILDWAKEAKVQRAVQESSDGEEGNYASKLFVSRADFRTMVVAIETNTRAIKELLEHEDEEKRILYRVEKQLDKFDN